MQPIVKTVSSDSTLLDLAFSIKDEVGLSKAEDAVFVMTFPRKIIEGSELNKSMKELGLVPSSSLLLKL